MNISKNPIIKISACGILNLALLSRLSFDWLAYVQPQKQNVAKNIKISLIPEITDSDILCITKHEGSFRIKDFRGVLDL